MYCLPLGILKCLLYLYVMSVSLTIHWCTVCVFGYSTVYCMCLGLIICTVCVLGYSLYPRYEVYRGYIVFAFSVIMFVGLSVCL